EQEQQGSGRGAGHGNRHEILVQKYDFLAFHQLLCLNSTRIRAMYDPWTAEVFVELLMVRYIIAMRKHHKRNTSKLLHTPYKRFGEARRVDKDVAFGARN